MQSESVRLRIEGSIKAAVGKLLKKEKKEWSEVLRKPIMAIYRRTPEYKSETKAKIAALKKTLK